MNLDELLLCIELNEVNTHGLRHACYFDIYERGVEAFQGKLGYVNPYEEGTAKYEAWDDGYYEIYTQD